jgi:restriction system protein
METRFGQVTVTYSPRGAPTFRAEAFHDGLHKYALIRAGDVGTLRNKLEAQALQWNTNWKKQCETEARVQRTYLAKEMRRFHIETRKAAALERTTEAQQLLETLRTLLISGIELDPSLDWNKLKVTTPFSESIPPKPEIPPGPQEKPTPASPERSDFAYRVRFSLLDHLIASRKAAKLAGANRQFDADMSAWNATCAALSAAYKSELKSHRSTVSKIREQYVKAVEEWEARKFTHEEEEARQHASIDELRGRYETKIPDAVIGYCERVLSNSEYPSCIPREFDFELNPESGVLLLNCKLPAPNDIPTLAEVRYTQITDTFSEKHLS